MLRRAILVPLLLWASTAGAQQMPSEKDIFALYCMGVFRVSTEAFAQNYSSACPTGNERGCQLIREAYSTNENGLKQTKRYLLARGYLSGAQQGIVPQLLFTVKSGEDDQRRCVTWRMNNLEAVLEGRKPQFCKQADKCGDFSRLPM
jgi:hypothetical protein